MKLAGRPMSPAAIAGWGTAAVCVIAVAAAVILFLQPSPSYQPKSKPVSAPSVMPSVRAAASPGVTPAAYSVPVSLSIPGIGVSGVAVIPEGCSGPPSKCVLNTPPLTGPQAGDVGWWDGSQGAFTPGDGTTPGQDGPAILVAHVNSAAEGNLTFASLNEMKAGMTASVKLADGVTVTFTAYATQEVPKDTFPTAQVYGMTTGPELRLITCGGAFDSQTGHYVDNFIVYLRAS